MSCENLSQRALVEIIDDLRARSGAAELFADEALTRACATADLVHGAVVYAPPDGDAVVDGEEGGDAMAEDEEG